MFQEVQRRELCTPKGHGEAFFVLVWYNGLNVCLRDNYVEVLLLWASSFAWSTENIVYLS